MANGTDVHVGFFAPQSKHIYVRIISITCTHVFGMYGGDLRASGICGTHLIRRLGVQLREDVLGLCLACQSCHGEGCVRRKSKEGASPVVLYGACSF